IQFPFAASANARRERMQVGGLIHPPHSSTIQAEHPKWLHRNFSSIGFMAGRDGHGLDRIGYDRSLTGRDPRLLRLGAIDQGVGGAPGRGGREGFAPDHRALGASATARPRDLILAGVGSRLARAQTFGVLAHVGYLVSVPGNTWGKRKAARRRLRYRVRQHLGLKNAAFRGRSVTSSGNSLYLPLFSYKPPEIQVDFGTYIAEL